VHLSVVIRILGPVDAVGSGGPVRVGGGRQLTLFGLLAVHAGEPVSADRLVDELVGAARPRALPSRGSRRFVMFAP
jgi:hypothetical protein